MFARRGGLALVCPVRSGEFTMVEQVQEQFAGLMARRAFEPVRRHLTGSDADDRLAEGIGMAFEMAMRKAQQGVRLDDALLVHAVRLRAVEIRRQFVKGGQPRRDALHRANYTDGRTEVFHIDGFEDEDGVWSREGDVALHAIWFAAASWNPELILAAAVDLKNWLVSIGQEDRHMLAARLAGYSLQEIASKTDRSTSAVFARLRVLGTELAQRAGIEVKKRSRVRQRRAPVRA